MAKAKKDKSEDGAVEVVNKDKSLIDKYGAGAFTSGSDFIDIKREIMNLSPKIDLGLGGGIPEGSFVILAGPPKCGKTVTSLHLAAKMQKKGRKVFFLNIEGRLKARDMRGIKGLDPSQVEVIGSYKQPDGSLRILNAEEYLEIAEQKINDYPGCLVIIDSVSQLLSEAEKIGDIGERHRAPGAVLLSQFCKKISNVIPINRNIVVAMVHIIANTGGGHKTTQRSGGNKIQYAVDVDLECKWVEKWMVGVKKDVPDSGTQIGQKVHWITGSTAIAPPGIKITSYIRYGTGVDEIYELFDLGKLLGLFTKSGNWYEFTFLAGTRFLPDGQKIPNMNGDEKAHKLLTDNPEWVEYLDSQVREMLITPSGSIEGDSSDEG